jgi:hypothetical protein
VHVGESAKVTENYFAISYWQTLLGFSVLGCIFLLRAIRNKQYFIVLMLVSSSIMTISYLFPVQITLYWRYFPFIFLSCSFLLSAHIFTFERKYSICFILLCVGIGMYGSYTKVSTLLTREPFAIHEFDQVMSHVPPHAILLSDPNTSYHIAPFYTVSVASVPYNHANPALIAESKIRYEDTFAFFSTSTTEQQSSFLNKYHVQYVLINQHAIPDYIAFDYDRAWLKTFSLTVPSEVVYKNEYLTLYKI